VYREILTILRHYILTKVHLVGIAKTSNSVLIPQGVARLHKRLELWVQAVIDHNVLWSRY